MKLYLTKFEGHSYYMMEFIERINPIRFRAHYVNDFGRIQMSDDHLIERINEGVDDMIYIMELSLDD